MRDRLVAATAGIIRERGLAAATIREVAATAGVAEGSVYNYFSGKIDLISAALAEQMPTSLFDAVKRLLASIGTDTTKDNLEAFVRDAAVAYTELDAHAAMLAADPETAASLRSELTRQRRGPGRAHEAVAAYLQVEEQQGRARLTAPPMIIAMALLGACHEYAFIPLFSEDPPFPDAEQFAGQLVDALIWESDTA